MKYLLLLSCSLVGAAPASAQAAGNEATVADLRTDPDTIVVVATGSKVPLLQSGQSISVIDAKELESIQGPNLIRALERLPGVSYARNGGLGSKTSLFVRGANSEQLLVTIDGVRVEDIAAPSGGFDLAL